jgi:MtN3 and saliva related transmembrane protein
MLRLHKDEGLLSNLLTSAIGSLAALASVTSFLPQIVKIIRERDASSVSLRMYALTVTAFTLWTSYGALIGSWPIIVSNATALTVSAFTLYLKWHFGRRNRA